MRRIGFGLVVLVLLVMTACKPETTIKDTIINENNNETIEGEQVEKTMTEIVTKAWILEQYNLTESDLEGIDVESIAENLWWTREEVIKDYADDSERLLKVLKASQLQIEKMQAPSEENTDYTSLWANGLEGELPDFKDLQAIEFMAYSVGEEYYGNVSGYLDINANTIYYCNGEDAYDLLQMNKGDACQKYEMTDEEIQEILGLINTDYLDKKLKLNEDIWSIALVYSDGSIYNYSLENVNKDEGKLAMVTKFFDKMEDRDSGNTFFMIWP